MTKAMFANPSRTINPNTKPSQIWIPYSSTRKWFQTYDIYYFCQLFFQPSNISKYILMFFGIPFELSFELLIGIFLETPIELFVEIRFEIPFEIPFEIRFEILLEIHHHSKTPPPTSLSSFSLVL